MNWPFADFAKAKQQFAAVHYPEAAKFFEQVVGLDPAADMSRAYAIACYWETRDTNRAVSLSKQFKDPSARWAQWADAKAEIETGDTNKATLKLVNLTTNYPDLWTEGFISAGSHVWRNANWQLFKERTAGILP